MYAEAPDATPVPPVIPGYRTGPFLGAGGSGQVWTVVRDGDGARLAAKVLAPDQETGLESALLQRLEHDHVLRLVDVVLAPADDGTPRTALITELAGGGSLADAVAGRGHLTVGELVTVLCPIARAVHDLHSLGLVHGDLSPANILLTDDGRPLIADLGIARLAGMADAEVWGSNGFVAPEVLDGGAPGPAADVYALGALAWTALVGTPPEPAALRPDLGDVAPQAPAALRDLVLTCLAHTAEARPAPGDFALRLWELGTPEPAPVAGSTGRRTASVVDPAAGLTQRIRERAVAVPEPPVAPWWRHRVVRTTSVAAAALGAACAGYAALGSPASGGTGSGSGAPRTTVSATQAPTTDAPRPGPSRATPAASASTDARSTPGALVRAVPSAHPTAARPTSTSSGSAVPTSPASPTPSADPRSAGALGSNPRAVVQTLAAARARAWTTGREADLAGALEAGSPAWNQDRRDLQAASRGAVRYAGLTFTVRQAALELVGDHAVVDVVVDRSAYTVTQQARPRTVPASRAELAELTLTWTSSGWRIASWTPR
ncbi:serine/threonine protein kinase [Luteipulveratus halotolerans]|uniref:serine/threonine protein kinase n=1 Tax=Luteipulveratus halotolerans TaxID=1631356 RepID=UPI000681D728|nr:serine/threonine-protein kinase [Luteipulveratus halotolerans]